MLYNAQGATGDESSEAQQRGTRRTLVRVLETLLRLTHPIMPYITEEIWQKIAPLAGIRGDGQGAADTIMTQPYPIGDDSKIDEVAEAEMQWVMDFIVGVRKIRSGMNIPPSKPLPVLLQNGNDRDKQLLEANQRFLSNLAKTESITWLEATDEAPESATSLIGEMKLLVPMAGLIDTEAELTRLNKEIDKLSKELQRINGKLSNAGFVDKAPAAVVEKEKAKAAEVQASMTQLKEQLEKIKRLK